MARKQMYEERIIVLRAESIDAAIARAEKKLKSIAAIWMPVDYNGYVNVFAMYDDEISDRSEILSSMQRSMPCQHVPLTLLS